jgi:hypothetical protein
MCSSMDRRHASVVPVSLCFAPWSAIAPLRDGSSTFGQVSAGMYRFYKLYIDESTTTFTLSLSPLSGSPVMYVIPERSVNHAYVLPSQSNYNWSSVAQGGRVVTVYNTDPAFVPDATYVVGVYSAATTSSFFITASLSGDSFTQLVNGQPQVVRLIGTPLHRVFVCLFRLID